MFSAAFVSIVIVIVYQSQFGYVHHSSYSNGFILDLFSVGAARQLVCLLECELLALLQPWSRRGFGESAIASTQQWVSLALEI